MLCYRKQHHQKASFGDARDSGSDFVMANKTYTSTEQYHVELEPSLTLKAKDADTIEMHGISNGNNHEGELILICYRKLIATDSCFMVHNIYI